MPRLACFTAYMYRLIIMNVWILFSDKSRRDNLLQGLREELKSAKMIFNKDQLQLSRTIGQGTPFQYIIKNLHDIVYSFYVVFRHKICIWMVYSVIIYALSAIPPSHKLIHFGRITLRIKLLSSFKGKMTNTCIYLNLNLTGLMNFWWGFKCPTFKLLVVNMIVVCISSCRRVRIGLQGLYQYSPG